MPTPLWCPFAVRAPIVGHTAGAGDFTGGMPKILHHITVGTSYVGAYLTYKSTGNLPHFTDSFEGIYGVWQHLPIDVAASALEHPKNSAETNRDNVIQIEHVGLDGKDFQTSYLDGIGRLCRWIESVTGCPPTTGVKFTPLDEKPSRLEWDRWHTYSGHLGHQHVPFNHHTDPGAINIVRILGVPPGHDAYPKGTDVPAPTDKVRYIPNPARTGGWKLQADGGVFADGDVPGFPSRYAILGNDGSVFHFPYGDVMSYPGLPSEARQGSRYFTDFWLE